MYVSAVKQNYMVKSILFVSFLFVMSLSLIGGCSDGGGEQNSTRALTEINFAEDSALRAKLEEGVVVTFLESPISEEDENDTGEVGIDLIPLRYAQTTEQTFCWEDDNVDAMHFMELQDSQGSTVLTVDVNGDCVEQVIEAGDYVMSIHHDGSVEDSLPIFLIPHLEDSEQARKTDGIINRIKLFASNVIKKIEGTVTEDALADTVLENFHTLLRTRSCVGCNLQRATIIKRQLSGANLRGADLSGANMRGTILNNADLREVNFRDTDMPGVDLSGADLSGADLRAILVNAILTDANLTGANLGRAHLTGATWCDGSCECTEGSRGTCNGCAPVSICTGP